VHDVKYRGVGLSFAQPLVVANQEPAADLSATVVPADWLSKLRLVPSVSFPPLQHQATCNYTPTQAPDVHRALTDRNCLARLTLSRFRFFDSEISR
jgi:hypothetical protein